MNTILRVNHVSKKYSDVVAVDNVSFVAGRGEVIGFVGLNGAGKSTTINMLLGYIKPTTGDITLFGKPLSLPGAANSHQRIGFATGDMSLFDNMTGQQYHNFVARAYKSSTNNDYYRQLVDRFKPQLNKRIVTLSRGNKQKIVLIAAFMTQPELIILDEPSSGLDPLMQQEFIDLLREVSAQGTTIFMSSHYLTEVVDVCTRVLFIKNGKLVKDIPAQAFESAGGKLVRIVTKLKVLAPKTAENVVRETRPDGQLLQFITKDSALRLQAWLGTLPHLQDLSITDHSAEAAFSDLYRTNLPTSEQGASNV